MPEKFSEYKKDAILRTGVLPVSLHFQAERINRKLRVHISSDTEAEPLRCAFQVRPLQLVASCLELSRRAKMNSGCSIAVPRCV
jgi:hypothetical protein